MPIYFISILYNSVLGGGVVTSYVMGTKHLLENEIKVILGNPKVKKMRHLCECPFHVKLISTVLKYSLLACLLSQSIFSSLVSNYDMYP